MSQPILGASYSLSDQSRCSCRPPTIPIISFSFLKASATRKTYSQSSAARLHINCHHHRSELFCAPHSTWCRMTDCLLPCVPYIQYLGYLVNVVRCHSLYHDDIRNHGHLVPPSTLFVVLGGWLSPQKWQERTERIAND